MDDIVIKSQYLKDYKRKEVLINQIKHDYEGLLQVIDMNLESLNEIVLTEDIHASIKTFNEEYGCNICGSAEVTGKVLTSPDKNNKRILIKLHSNTSDDSNAGQEMVMRLFSLRVLAHEITHVHEDNTLKLNDTTITGIDLALKQICLTVWSEYYANRGAMNIILKIIRGDDAASVISEFIHSDVTCSEDILKFLKEPKQDTTNEVRFDDIVQALRNIAYVKGSLHGINIFERIDGENTIYSYLKDSTILDNLSNELNRIYKLNLSWNDVEELNDLALIILKIIIQLGYLKILNRYVEEQEY